MDKITKKGGGDRALTIPLSQALNPPESLFFIDMSFEELLGKAI